MALADDIADDYLGMDGVEEITFTPQTPVATAINSVKAIRGPLGRPQAVFGQQVGISPSDVVFNLWVSTMGDTPPDVNPGDLITDADNIAYTVISCQLKTLRTRWQCVCRKNL